MKTLARTADERRSPSWTGKAKTGYAERKEAGLSRLGLLPVKLINCLSLTPWTRVYSWPRASHTSERVNHLTLSYSHRRASAQLVPNEDPSNASRRRKREESLLSISSWQGVRSWYNKSYSFRAGREKLQLVFSRRDFFLLGEKKEVQQGYEFWHIKICHFAQPIWKQPISWKPGKIGITAISAYRAHENHAFFHFLEIFGSNHFSLLSDIKILLSFHFTRAINKAFCWFTVPSSLYYWLTADKTGNSSSAQTCYSCKQGSQDSLSNLFFQRPPLLL